MRINFCLILFVASLNSYGQKCPKYERAVKAGDEFLIGKKYKEAIVEFQAAQIAARECGQQPDLIDRFKKVFDGLAKLKDEADVNRLLAEKATLLARNRLLSEQVEKTKAERLRDVAKSQAYANAAYVFCEKDPTMAMSFAFSSLEIQRNRMALIAMLKAFNMNSWFYNKSWDDYKDAALSSDGRYVSGITATGGLEIEDLHTGKNQKVQVSGDNILFLPNNNILVWSKTKYGKSFGTITLMNQKGQLISTNELKFLYLSMDEKGTVTIPALDVDGKLQFNILNSNDGKLTKLFIPEEYNSLSLVYAVSSKFAILSNDYPGNIWVAANGATGIFVPAPPKKHITSIDIRGFKAIFYLRSSIRGEADVVGVFNLNGINAGRKMNFYPLRETLGNDASGSVKFLDDNNIIATSTDGWSKIVNLDSRATYSIEGLRPVDQIISVDGDSTFVLARRSGEITIYDFKGIPISNLQSTESSDGINYAFSKVMVDKIGQQVLTVSRNNSRLWQRPRYHLKSRGSILDKDTKDVNKSYFTKFNFSGMTDLAIVESDPLLTTPVNNFGEIFLQFHLAGYTDLFRANLYTTIENVVTFEQEDDITYTIFTDKNYKRNFVLKPDLVFRLVKKEFEDGRILEIPASIKSRWVESDVYIDSNARSKLVH